jgi:uncharacterized protein YegJ (DUF2314 family)
MRLPFLTPRRDEGLLRLPFAREVPVGFGVYFRPAGPAPPHAEAVKITILEWLERHAEDPLRPQLRAELESGELRIDVGGKEMLPGPPLEQLRMLGAGEEEAGRYASATHLAVFSFRDTIRPPRLGLWLTLAAARAVAEQHQGVILDPEIPRLTPLSELAVPLPADGRIQMSEHITLFCSVDRRGLAWMTSKGMAKFGLSELEISDVPPDLTTLLMPIVNALAHRLWMAAVARSGIEPSARELTLDSEFEFAIADLARAYGEEGEEPPEGVPGRATMRLEHRGRRRAFASDFVRLVPPRGFRGGTGVWLNEALQNLLGVAPTCRLAATDSESMQAAHRRAAAELPGVKARFHAGLRPGERLHVKHGFPLRDGDHEYMWLVVNTWRGERLRGQLVNAPHYRRDLQAGQSVELCEEEVFDWVLLSGDGEMEGGYTDRVVQEQGAAIE